MPYIRVIFESYLKTLDFIKNDTFFSMCKIIFLHDFDVWNDIASSASKRNSN